MAYSKPTQNPLNLKIENCYPPRFVELEAFFRQDLKYSLKQIETI